MGTESGYSITFSECVENHVGMQKLGEKAEQGLQYKHLKRAMDKFTTEGYECQMIDIKEALPRTLTDEDKQDIDDAWILVVRKGVEAFGTTEKKLRKEMDRFDVDTQAFMKGRVVNKHARHNLCFADEFQEPDFEHGKGTIIPFSDLPQLSMIRDKIHDYIGSKGRDLYAELNKYYDMKQCYIGYHIDGERKIVVCARLGADYPIYFQWYLNREPVGRTLQIDLDMGDMYIMSEAAAGISWFRRDVYLLRHAAASADCYHLIEPKPKKGQGKVIRPKKLIYQ